SCSGTSSTRRSFPRRPASRRGDSAAATRLQGEVDALLGDDDRGREEDDRETGHRHQLAGKGLAPGEAALGRDDDQPADQTADDPAEVAADADVRGGEREDEVDDEPERELLDDLHVAALAGDQD